MDKETLDQRTHQVFHLLSCEDLRYPRTNFFVRLIDDTKRCLMHDSNPHDLSDSTIHSVITKAVHQLVRSYEPETKWQEINGSWFSEDIYEALKVNIEQLTN